MMPPYYLYADITSLTVLEGPEEKVWLVGGDFGYGNFGDIMQHRNVIAYHRRLGRYRSVSLMAANAIGDTEFPEFARQTYSADAVVFFSETPLDLAAAGLKLQPVRSVNNSACLHLYGGGFLNTRWGSSVLNVTEYLLHALHIQTYVVSGQQITAPFERQVLRHIESFRPALFGVRDELSQRILSETGYPPLFSFDDATEALQSLTSAMCLSRGHGLLMQLNVSYYTSNAMGDEGLHRELSTLRTLVDGHDNVTLLHAFADRRMEVVDTRESIKQLERAFPFSDYRMIELTPIAYQWPVHAGAPLEGEIGYSCSYHVALWLQLSGIPCWLRGQNEFYRQKAEALQVQQSLTDFLADPRLADHSRNIEQRLIWQERLDNALLSAPGLHRICELPSVIGQKLSSFHFKARELPQQASIVEAPASGLDDRAPAQYQSPGCDPDSEDLHALVLALNAQITKLGSAANELRLRAEWAEAKLAEEKSHPKLVMEEAVQSRLEITALREALTERDLQITSLNHTIEQLNHVNDQRVEHERGLVLALDGARSEADSLYKQLDRVLRSHSWRVTRPFRAGMRLLLHGHLNADATHNLFDLARRLGNRLPAPLWMKARARQALIYWRFRKDHGFQPNIPRRVQPDFASRLGDVRIEEAVHMRPECCGLQPGLVSVVLPVYNQALLLDESIQSVLAQTYDNFELIIVNDGSTDDVESVLERYLDHPRVRCYTQPNQRLPKALSNGFSFATGEFWTWTSADNVMEPQMLELLVAKLRSEPTLGMVYADYIAIDDRGGLLQDRSWRAHNRPVPNSAEIRLPRTAKALNRVQDNFIGPCFMYRGWIGRCLGDYDPQLGIEDYDYWMRINAFFELRHLGSQELLYRYRVHDNSLSAKAHEQQILEKARRLMDYERARAKFYRAEPRFLADTESTKWLLSFGVFLDGSANLVDDGGAFRHEAAAQADLIIVTSDTAATHLASLTMLSTPTAVIFGDGDSSYQKVQRLLNRPGCLSLVSSKVVADRVRLVAACPVMDLQSTQACGGVLAFAKNYRFFHSTRNAAELERELPQRIHNPAKRHVLLQVDSLVQGGMENVVIDLARSLTDVGFEVTIANLGESGDAAAQAREYGLRVQLFRSGISEDEYVAWLKAHDVSLVNAHYSIFAAAACRRSGIPFVETVHNSYVWFDPVMIRNYRQADAHVTRYICVSNTAAEYADVVLGLDVSKMQVIPNGIDASHIDATHYERNRQALRARWQVNPESPVFLNVASIMATKAQLPLVKAFAGVLKHSPKARLVLLGRVMEKPYQRSVEKAVDALGIGHAVIFAGYDRQVAMYYHAADVFVLPSFWEGWSLSLGEAVANGLSCVITNVGSAYEFAANPRVEVIAPPFGEVTNLNFHNLGEYVYGEDLIFIETLAKAMERASRHARGAIDTRLANLLDRRLAYARYAEIFHEIPKK